MKRTEAKNSEANLFSADRPIISKEQDSLGRTGFAESLANAIKGWRENDSLVIALYGPWGSGKTSIKNLVLEYLKSSKDNPVEIVEFNPWQWSGQDQLAEAFFREIGVKLKSGKQSKSRLLAKRWNAFAAYLGLGSYVFEGLRRAIILILLLLALFGFLKPVIPSWVSLPVGILAAVFAVLLAWLGGFAEKVARVFNAHSALQEKTLRECKDEITTLLSKSTKSFLVVLDDVDRLTPEQIRFLFQIIKANADFPKLIYLLLFEREIIERSLDVPNSVKGSEYLEKIVQVGFDVPRIQHIKLEQTLFAGLNRLLGEGKVTERFKQERWNNLFVAALRPFFKTLRDVHRYLATLSFHVGLHRTQESFEVNPIDLIALEVLRLFEPRVYHGLPDLKHYLTGLYQRGHFGDETEKDTVKKTLESLVSSAQKDHQSAVRELLRQLFTPIEWVFGGSHYGSEWQEQWLRELRVCNPDVFDRYFHFLVPEGDLPQGEIDALLANSGNREALVQRYRGLKERGMLGVALDRLEAYKQEINPAHALPFITALFDIGDELPEDRIGFYDLAYDMHAVRIIYWYLKKDADHNRRVKTLKEAMEQTTGLYLPVKYTSIEDSKKKEQRDPDAFNIEGEDLKQLQKICVGKIRQSAKSGKLQGNPQLSYILYRWKEWDDEAVVKDWVSKTVMTKDGLVGLLSSFLHRYTSQSVDEYVPRVLEFTPFFGHQVKPVSPVVVRMPLVICNRVRSGASRSCKILPDTQRSSVELVPCFETAARTDDLS